MAQVVTAEELLVRVSQRDEEALSDLYDRFAPRLLGALARILHARPLAEEVLQEVFLRLWSEARGLIEAEGSVAAWLVVNARHLALERLRAEKQALVHAGTKQAKEPPPPVVGPGHPTASGLVAPQSREAALHKARRSKPRARKSPPAMLWPAAWIPSPEEVAQVEERLDLLQKVINQLPKHQRGVLELSMFGGYSEEEIARELDEPLGQVRTALCAAVTYLRHRRRAVMGTWAANI
jgi:RNA polymerase sigma-70 factor (ECF subfamily)